MKGNQLIGSKTVPCVFTNHDKVRPGRRQSSSPYYSTTSIQTGDQESIDTFLSLVETNGNSNSLGAHIHLFAPTLKICTDQPAVPSQKPTQVYELIITCQRAVHQSFSVYLHGLSFWWSVLLEPFCRVSWVDTTEWRRNDTCEDCLQYLFNFLTSSSSFIINLIELKSSNTEASMRFGKLVFASCSHSNEHVLSPP